MPQVPYTGVPTIDPNYPATPQSNLRADPAAFGLEQAAAGRRLAGAFEKVGDELFARAYAMQEMDQQADADNAHSAASDAVGKLVMDFRSKSGLAAKNAYDPFVKDVDAAIDQGEAGLTSDYAKKLYRAQTNRLRQYTVESAGAHAGAEFKHYQIGTQKAGIDNSIMTASLHPEDSAAYEQARTDIQHRSETIGILEGWGPEQVQELRNKSHSQLVHDRVINLARTDPVAAQKILDDAAKGGEVSGEMVGKAGEFIRQQRNQTLTRVESKKILGGEGFHFGETKDNDMEAIKYAIGKRESSNNYQVLHPLVTEGRYKGQRAIGRYGIMPGNLRQWLAEAGMPSMSATEFEQDSKAQDQLFETKWNQIRNRPDIKSDNEAAIVWFAGDGGLEKYRKDPEAFGKVNDKHTSAPVYLRDFNRYLGEKASSAKVESIATARAEKLVPGDTEFHYNLRDATIAEHAKDRRVEFETDFTNRHTVEAALGHSPDGKLPTSIEDISDPAVHAAWDALPEYLRTRYNKVFAANAKNDYAPTTENQQEFRAWLGRLTDGMASEEDRKAALDADFLTMKLPMSQRQQLIGLQKKMFGNKAANPKLEHAMSVLQTQLFNADVTRKTDEEAYFQFRGELHDILQQRMEDGKYPDDEEIKKIGAGLLRETVVGKRWFGLTDATGKAFQMEVPDGEAEKIRQIYLDSKGMEPDEKTIQQIYAVNQFNQFYAKKPKADAK